MDLLQVTCFLGLFPALYPLGKLIHKKEINLFDLIILFHTLNFMAVPLWKGNIKNWSDEGIISVFVYYILFIVLLLLFDIHWDKRFRECTNPINITRYLQNFNNLKISKVGTFLLTIIFLVAIVYYMPRATYILELEDAGVELDPSEKTSTFVFGNIFNVTGIVLTLHFVYGLKNRKIVTIGNLFLGIYLILNLFFPRRIFILLVLQIFLCVYAVKRDAITKKLIFYSVVVAMFLYLVYFPFYNIMRQGAYEVKFNPNEPIESMGRLASYAWDNWGAMSVDATDASDERSLNLYDAVYDLMKYENPPMNGELTRLAIDIAIPRILNPHKAEGSQPVLEEMTKHYKDQADSYLLVAYGEFHFIGALYALLLFVIVTFSYLFYGALWSQLFHSYMPKIYVTFICFALTWNVEGTIDSFLPWFFSSLPLLVMLVILEKKKIIEIKKTSSC